MEYVSLPRVSIGSRWQPARAPGGPQLQAWHPAPPRLAAPPAAPSPALGQVAPADVGSLAISSVAAAGTAVTGFALALFGPKDKPTWRWIGGLAGAVGTLRMLQEVSKLKI